jgi:hypothetical protein
MPIIGLSSGLKIKCSQQQYKAFMKRREPYIEGAFIELHDDDRNPVGKIKPSFIEFVCPDNSEYFGFAPKPVTVKAAPVKPTPSYKSKKFNVKKS